jgi:hypothetical protein
MEENGSSAPDPSTISVPGDTAAAGDALDDLGSFSFNGWNFFGFRGVDSKTIRPVTAPGHFLPSRTHWEHSGVFSSHCVG